MTRGKGPADMGASCAVMSPMTAGRKTGGDPAVAQGSSAVGRGELVVAGMVTWTGTAWREQRFPAEG
ncbi:uracil permease, partial [Leuconostoc mesenteroides]|nr:uracil permease [Leuconostoc mesenteroides]